jgi:regulator of RNase E activity RraA
MTFTAGVGLDVWDRALSVAAGDRLRLARMVRDGRVRRVKGVRALDLPSLAPPVNPTIRPKKKRGKR